MKPADIFLTFQAQTTPHALCIEVERAEGSYIFSPDGKAYLDMISGLAVTNIGHRHPKVLAAILAQLDKYMHVMPYGEFVQTPQTDLAQKLNNILPDRLDVSYFVNSGAEAVEAALKLAKRYTGRRKMVSMQNSYHGSTHGALSVSGNEGRKAAYRPLLPGVHFMRFGEIEDLQIIDEQTACVITETIQGDAGVRQPTKAYMQALRKRCDDVGSLLILDEIQTGFGRTGSLFAFEHYGIQPDILTLAKGMAGGMAMGAFVGSAEIMKALSHDPILGHITTFGGHPVCCAAALANIEVIMEPGLIEGVEAKGALLENQLSHPAIVEIRRKGLMLAVEFESADLVYQIVDKCIEMGLITFYFLSCPDSFRLAPPLNISEADLQKACDIINEAISSVIDNQ